MGFKNNASEISSLKVSCIFTMDNETYQELQGIQSALNNLPIMKSELTHATNDSDMTGNRSKFKKPFWTYT